MFEQAAIPVQDEAHFRDVKAALDKLFAVANVGRYLQQLKSSNVRVRDFEGALRGGLLGQAAVRGYQALGDSDRGQIREFYLSLVERVAPELRAKFLKIYAYY